MTPTPKTNPGLVSGASLGNQSGIGFGIGFRGGVRGSRVLLLATTTGYQTRSFGEAAAKLGVELVFGLDRCRGLDDPWGDRSLAVRFYDDPRSVEAIVSAAADGPINGVLAVGDRPTVLAACAAEALGLPFHSPAAARISRNKLDTRLALSRAGLSGPSFAPASIDDDPEALAHRAPYPCVVKPLALSGSRGVIRANTPREFIRAFRRVRHILQSPDVTTMKDPALRQVLVETFIPGAEFAVEGLMQDGRLNVLAIFDKPDPLDGPFFEETIYVTPSAQSPEAQAAIVAAVEAAAIAIGLSHGPVHAECRVNGDGVFVLEAAARPIGGLCARALRFTGPGGEEWSFEEVLLRHALGEDVRAVRREAHASGVMMVPIVQAGVFRGVSGVADAQAVTGVEDVVITAKADQHLVPLPEGAAYLGFIFARAGAAHAVTTALREAHRRLRFKVDRELPIVPAPPPAPR
jgi:formate-dependent phosphoribosylglycinamide formyltransferase (GAR transformylase)